MCYNVIIALRQWLYQHFLTINFEHIVKML
jgi:hypothetical protein